jgi:hypothetical protein
MATIRASSERAAALAPAAVALALFVALTEMRMDDPWAVGVLFLVALVPSVVVLGLALGASSGDAARGAATVLVVAGLALAGIAHVRLGQILGGGDWSEHGGTLTLMLVLFTAIAAYWYQETRSVAALLVAALAAVGLLLEGVNWIFGTDSSDVFRALLAVAFVLLFVAGLSVSGRPGTVLIAAAGVTVLVSSYLFGLFFLFGALGGSGAGWGWELIMLLEGVALLVYAAVELEPGPGYLALFVLAGFVLSAATVGGLIVEGDGGDNTSHTLVGWPLALAVATALATVWGLRGRPAD